jgi:hypothetical protein
MQHCDCSPCCQKSLLANLLLVLLLLLLLLLAWLQALLPVARAVLLQAQPAGSKQGMRSSNMVNANACQRSLLMIESEDYLYLVRMAGSIPRCTHDAAAAGSAEAVHCRSIGACLCRRVLLLQQHALLLLITAHLLGF